MAFLRRHRIVLVPPFAALIVAVGAVLLPCPSDEPGDVREMPPRTTVQPWRELVDQRTGHMRVWRIEKQVEYTDPISRERVTEIRTSLVRQVASNLCYRDNDDRWQPSRMLWKATATGFKADEGASRFYFGRTLAAGYMRRDGNTALWMQPHSLVLSDGEHSVVLAQVDGTSPGHIDPSDGRRLVFPNAFGPVIGADLECVVERSAFHQNIVLRRPIALPDGLDASRTALYVYTTLDFDGTATDGALSVSFGSTTISANRVGAWIAFSTTAPIALLEAPAAQSDPARARDLFAFGPSRVCDGAHRSTLAARRLWRDPATDHTYLVERLSHSWLKTATYPVTLDYVATSGAIDDDTVWTADATYYVSDDLYVAANTTLTIEPGTVVKFAPGAELNVTSADAKLRAQGEPFRTIVFTSQDDDACGETITGSDGVPSMGDYDAAIRIGSAASADCTVGFCKIGYATYGLDLGRDIGTVSHCIVTACQYGARLDGDTLSALFNNLFTECATAIHLSPSSASASTDIRNNTIDACSTGVYCTYSGSPPVGPFVICSNLITNSDNFGVRRTPTGTWGDFTVSNSGYYANAVDVQGVEHGSCVQLDVSPYASNALGAHFVAIEGDGDPQTTDGADLVDAGSGDAIALYGAAGAFDVAPPLAVESDITSSDIWSPRGVDSGTVDIGYHHPRIDRLIDGTTIAVGGADPVELLIEPGSVIALHGSATLQFATNAQTPPTLICCGTRNAPVVLVGASVTSMSMESAYDSATGLYLSRPGVGASIDIAQTAFTGLHSGIRVSLDSGVDIRDCRFDRAYVGIWLGYAVASCDQRVENCLFWNLGAGCLVQCLGFPNTQKRFVIRNATFDRCGTGVNVLAMTGYGSWSVTLLDNLLTRCSDGISRTPAPLDWRIDYNGYWSCERPLWNSGLPAPLGPHSFELDASPYATAWTAWADQWRLDQETPCVDAGSRHVVQAGLQYTTTALASPPADVATVDLGYHYPAAFSASASHFDNTTSHTTLRCDFDTSIGDRTIRIYDACGRLVYEASEPADDDEIAAAWDGTGNVGAFEGITLGPGAYTVVVTAGAGGEEYARFIVSVEQSGALGILHPPGSKHVAWY